MKDSLKKLGIVGPRHYRHLTEELRKAQARTVKVAQQLETARAEAHAYKLKADELAKTLRKQQADVERHVLRADRLSEQIDRIKKEAREKLEQGQRKTGESAQKRTADVEGLHQRLDAAERDLRLAREALMAVEVKLDILEGAANVLDLRLRRVAVTPEPTT